MGATEQTESQGNDSGKNRSGKGSSGSSSSGKGSSSGKSSGGSSGASSQSSGSQSSGSPEAAESTRKKPQRKPLWVAIPASYEEVTEIGETGDPETVTKPATYHFYKCDGKPEVRKALAKHNIDVSNIKDVVVLRAHPIEFKAQTQVSLKF